MTTTEGRSAGVGLAWASAMLETARRARLLTAAASTKDDIWDRIVYLAG